MGGRHLSLLRPILQSRNIHDPWKKSPTLLGFVFITYFPGTVEDIKQIIKHEFQIVELSDKGAELIEEDRFGYQSIHYLVKFKSQRSSFPEYAPFADSVTEIQVRTILQHAWAEIEHDVQYKSASVIPAGIRRRFMALAGMLELADREFQEIQNVDKELTREARSRVAGGELSHVEITPDALKAFLDKRLGADRRMSDWSYDWIARLLKTLRFRTLEQVEKCIRGFDDDQLSRIAVGSRVGQTTRFEYMLLAGMGEHYAHRHPWSTESWHEERLERYLELFRKAGVTTCEYDPLMDQPDMSTESDPAAGSTGSPEGQSNAEVTPNI